MADIFSYWHRMFASTPPINHILWSTKIELFLRVYLQYRYIHHTYIFSLIIWSIKWLFIFLRFESNDKKYYLDKDLHNFPDIHIAVMNFNFWVKVYRIWSTDKINVSYILCHPHSWTQFSFDSEGSDCIIDKKGSKHQCNNFDVEYSIKYIVKK